MEGLLLYPPQWVEMGVWGRGFQLFHVIYYSSFPIFKFNENKKTIRKVGKNLAGTDFLRKFAPEYARPPYKLIIKNSKFRMKSGCGN